MFSLSFNLGLPSINMGSMYIKLDKGDYSPGEQVTGVVMLNLMSIFNNGTVYLTVAGVEQVKLVERVTVGTGEQRKEENRIHTDRNFFFNNRIPLYHFSGGFAASGQYSFPFCFPLPSGLPSSFKFTFKQHGEDCFASTSYELKASLENGHETSLFYNIPLAVNQPMQLDNASSRMEMTSKINHCCCIDKGTSKIVSYFEKKEYFPGETAYLITEADNTQSQAAIKSIAGTFKQEVRLRAGTYEDRIHIDLKDVRLPGMMPGEQRTGPNAIRIEVPLVNHSHYAKENGIQPTSRGKLITNEYFIKNKLSMDVCNCCDTNPQCTLKLNIRNPSINYNPWQSMPSNWNPQVFSTVNLQFSADTRFDTNLFMNGNMNTAQANLGMTGFPQMPGSPQMPPPP